MPGLTIISSRIVIPLPSSAHVETLKLRKAKQIRYLNLAARYQKETLRKSHRKMMKAWGKVVSSNDIDLTTYI